MILNDTIAAIATPRGSGGIAIIRLSGENAETIAAEMVHPYGGKKVSELESHKLTLSRVCPKGREDFIIDEALVAVMRAPRSYTGENVVEINCHGGFLAADKNLRGLLMCGARLAEAGEFTRRAFINGKTDLSGAEAVMDLMNSSTDAGLHNAAMSMTGALAKKINALREVVLGLAAHVSAAADYPDEVDPIPEDELGEKLSELRSKVKSLLGGFDTGRIMRDGVRCAIVGKPNVGKSSILNALLRFERAIVTDIPGTTRDTIEELINVGGIALRISDTAGIRTASDEVEKIGIERSVENIKSADLCLFVIDSSEELSDEDMSIAGAIGDKKTILVLNKCDKTAKASADAVLEKLGINPDEIIETSAPKGEAAEGIDSLEKVISDMFARGAVRTDEVYIANERQRDSLIKAESAIGRAYDGLMMGMPYDMLFIDLEDALTALGEITGLTVSEEIIDSVFERFCVGK